MFCSCCGKELKDDNKFCPNCGNKNLLYKEVELVSEETTINLNEDNSEELKLPSIIEDKANSSPLVLGLLSIYFSILPFIGLILSIIGLSIDKNKKYRVYNLLGGILSICWIIIELVVLFITYFFFI